MRRYILLVGVLSGLAWAGSAQAQSSGSSSSSFFKLPHSLNINVMPNITNNSPMDYRNTNAPIGGSYFQPNTTGTAFPYTLSSMFFSSGRSNYISSTTTPGRSVYPTPAQMQASAPAYLAPFQMYRGQFISPTR